MILLATDYTKELLENDLVKFVEKDISDRYAIYRYKVNDDRLFFRGGYKEIIRYSEVYLDGVFKEYIVSYTEITHIRSEKEFKESTRIEDEF